MFNNDNDELYRSYLLARRVKRVLILLLLIGAIAVLLNKLNAQEVYAGAGIYGAAKPGGMAVVGIQFNKWSVQGDMQRGMVRPPTYFSLNAGYNFGIVRLYAGPTYRVTGNRSTQDRYVNNGIEQVLSKGYSTNCVSIGGGISAQLGRWVLDAGYKGHLSFAVLWVWRKNNDN
jgi:hypothetical protein